MKLKELSELLGLSQTTVSRALGGYPEVSEKTRRDVVLAAARHGYAPNAHARSLATGQSKVLGCVVPVSSRNEILNPIFSDFLAGVGEACAKGGFDISLKVVDDGAEEEAFRTMKSTSSVGGVILQSPRVDDARITLLRDLGLPFIVHGRSSEHEGPYSWLDVNNTRAMHRATSFLLELGHRRIALVNGPEYLDFAVRRRTGFLRALAEAGAEADTSLMFASDMTALHGYQGARAILERDDPATAIVAASTVVAWGIKQALDELGLRLKTDVSVVTFDDAISYLGNTAAMPVFTAVRSSVRTAGSRIANILITQIGLGDHTPVHELLEADLILGMSTGARADREAGAQTRAAQTR